MKDGKVSHAIVGVGGVAGVGERHVVVPWSRVKVRHEGNDRKDGFAVIEHATLDNAPRYTRVDRDRVPAASPVRRRGSKWKIPQGCWVSEAATSAVRAFLRNRSRRRG